MSSILSILKKKLTGTGNEKRNVTINESSNIIIAEYNDDDQVHYINPKQNDTTKENSTTTKEGNAVTAKEKDVVTHPKEKNVVTVNEKDAVTTNTKDVATAREKDVVTAREKDVVTAKEKDVVTAREKDVVTAREKDVVTAKEKDVVSAREKDVTVKEKNAVTTNPNNVVTTREKDVVTVKEKDAATTKENNVASSNEKKVASSKEKKVASSKEKKVASSKEKKVASSKGKKVASTKGKKTVHLDPCVPCPVYPKLVGCNLDSGIRYLSPRSEVKCRDLCRLQCRCPKPPRIVIRPGDGARWDYYRDRPEEARADGYVPPYDFNRRKTLCAPPPCPCGFENARKTQPAKDFIQANAVEATRAVPKIPIPRIAVNHHGDTTDWCKSGWALNHVFSDNFGRLPRYICRVKNILAMEDYRLICNLVHNSDTCRGEEHNVMNEMGLLELMHTKNPSIWPTPLFVKPKPVHGPCESPFPRFLPY